MKHLSSKEFSEMLKQHKQETKVAHKKKLYNKITKEVKNLSMENNDRRKILNSYQRFLKKQSGGAYTKPELEEPIDLVDYNKDIEDLTNFVKTKNAPKIEKNNINCSYLKKIMDSINDQSDFFTKIKATQIKNIISKHKFNTLGLLLDFLNYWMRYVKNTEKNTVDTTKTKLTNLVEALKNEGFDIEKNQVPSDLDNLHYNLENMTNDEQQNLCALDNILSVIILPKEKNKAQLVNYNFIQDMGIYLSAGSSIKEEIKGSTYTGLSAPGYDYTFYKKKYINVILENLPEKKNVAKNWISIYTSIMKKASTLKGTKGWVGTKTIANVSDIKNIPESTMEEIRAGLTNLYDACGKIQNDITTLKNKLPQKGEGAIDATNFNANSVKALYHVFSQSALLKQPIENYYSILSNPDLIGKFIKRDGTINKKKSANGTKNLGAFVETNGTGKQFLSDVIFSKIAIGAYDDPDLPNNLTKSAYKGWEVIPPPPAPGTVAAPAPAPAPAQVQAPVDPASSVPVNPAGTATGTETGVQQQQQQQQQQQTGGPVSPGPVTGVQQQQPQQQQQGTTSAKPVLNPVAKSFTPATAPAPGPEAKAVVKVKSKFKEGQKVLNAKNKKIMYNIKNVLPDGKYKIRPGSATDNKNNKVVGENNIIEVPKPTKKK